MHPKRAHTNVANVYSLLISAHHTLRAHVPKSLCKLAGVVTNLQGLTAKRALHEKRASVPDRYFAEMGLDEEKTALGEEIVSEQDEDSDPEDEGEEEEAPGDGGGDGDDDEEDEEELEDPLDKVREACGEHAECAKLKDELELCNQRVSSRSNTEETCVQELFDFLECQDKCIGHRLFSKLK